MKRRKIQAFLAFTLFVQLYFVTCYDEAYYDRCLKHEFSCSSQVPGLAAKEDCVATATRTSSFDECRNRFVSQLRPMLLETGGEIDDDLFKVSMAFNSVTSKQNSVMPVLNISTEFGKNTKGLLIWMGIQPFDAESSYCRLVFINKTVVNYPLTLYYDCLFFHREEIGFRYNFNVMNFPNQDTKSFSSLVVDYEPFSKKNNDTSKWEIPIFLDSTCSKNRNDICIWFSEVPPHMGVYNYTVSLRNNMTVDNRFVRHVKGKGLWNRSHSVIFKDLQNDVTYEPVVTIEHQECLKPNLTCRKVLGQSFVLPANDQILAQTDLLHFILVASFSVIFVIFLVTCIFIQRNPTEEEKREVLVLYSCDNKCYMDLVQEFVKLLRCNHFIVHFDRDANVLDPTDWLRKNIFNDEIRIILIWSKGAVYKVKQDVTMEFQGEPGNFTSHLFSYSLKLIQSKTVRSDWHPRNYSNVINIVWDKLLISEVPMKQLPMYILPKRWDSLLYHLRYIRSPHLQCLGSCPILHKLMKAGLKTYPQGKLFLDAHRKMLQDGNYYEIERLNDSLSSNSGEQSTSINVVDSLDNPGSSGYYSMNNESLTPSDTNRGHTGVKDPSVGFQSDNEKQILIHDHPSSEDSDSSLSDKEENIAWIRDLIIEKKPQRTPSLTHYPHNVEKGHCDVSQPSNTHSLREVSVESVCSSSSSSSLSSIDDQPSILPYPAMFGFPSIGAPISPGMHFNPNHFGSVPTNVTHSP